MKTIVFDLDNTLIEWKDEYVSVLSNIVKSYNLGYDDDKIKELDYTLTQYDKRNTKYTKEGFLKFCDEILNVIICSPVYQGGRCEGNEQEEEEQGGTGGHRVHDPVCRSSCSLFLCGRLGGCSEGTGAEDSDGTVQPLG